MDQETLNALLNAFLMYFLWAFVVTSVMFIVDVASKDGGELDQPPLLWFFLAQIRFIGLETISK